MKHFKYGGSTADRTIACPGWHKLAEDMPRHTSEYAELGTALHSCMEEILLGSEPEEFIGETVNNIELTEEHIDLLRAAAQAFDNFCDAHDILDYEPEVFSRYDFEIGGTADAILRSEGAVYVLDFKFGKGIQIEPGGAQPLFYGMAARRNSSAKDMFQGARKFGSVIIQPNDRGLPVLRYHDHGSIDCLDEFERTHARAVKEAQLEEPPINAGAHCKFCPAAPVCPLKTGAALRALQMSPEHLDTLVEAMALVQELKPWMSEVEAAVFNQLEVGQAVPGWKLVDKRAMARWRDEQAVIDDLRRKLGGIKNMTVTKLKTPAQLRKIADEKGIDLEPYIIKTSSGHTLAPEDDKRPAALPLEALQKTLASVQ